MADGNNNEFPQGAPGGGSGNGGGDDVLDNSRPAVASAPAKTLVLVVLGLLFIGIVVKSLFFQSKPEIKNTRKEMTAPNDQSVSINPHDLPAKPSEITNIPPPPPPPPPPPVSAITPPPPPPPPHLQNGPTNEQLKARIHAPMLAVSSNTVTPAGTPSATAAKKTTPSDPNLAWAQGIEDSKAETVTATQVKNLNRTILQGKFIPGVLETAIDSSLPAPIRAITSHDTYAENGRNILIPKGSRIIGVYNSAVKRGQGRVFIIWTRVIRPDGVDIAIDSPGVDALGRGGMGGEVDNKYFETFSTAILTSSMDVAVAAIGDALFGNQNQSSSVGPSGTSTVNSSPTATAMQTAIQNLGTVGQSIVNNVVNLEPTIHVDQGSQINIFVNKDVVFPQELINGGEAGIIP